LGLIERCIEPGDGTPKRCKKHPNHYRCFIRNECIWCVWEEQEREKLRMEQGLRPIGPGEVNNLDCQKHDNLPKMFVGQKCVWCLREEHEKLLAEVSTFTMKLAAISQASLGNTRQCQEQRLPSSHQFYSQAYKDTCAAVDREIEHREELDKIKAALEVLKAL